MAWVIWIFWRDRPLQDSPNYARTMVYGHDSVARKMGMKPVLCLQQSCVDLFQLLYRLYSCGRLWNVAWMLHCR
ncbi:hypothetical protein B0T12DRAFT_426030 [Alternaria alternata]|nr:hypothetical protein B0T12DRAFT_426030 [Alternaria alternata]